MKSKIIFKKIILYVLLLINVAVYSQNKDLNLENKSFKELRKLFFKNENKQNELADLYLRKAKFENNRAEKIKGYYLKSFIKNHLIAIKNLDSALLLCKKEEVDRIKPLYKIAYHYLMLLKFDQSIKYYNEVEKISKTLKNEYYYHSRFQIGLIKSEKMGEVKEALPYYQEYYKYQKTNYKKEYYYNALFALADAYKSLNQLDSCTFYNKLGFQKTVNEKDVYFNKLFILNEGANHLKRNNYKVALDSISKVYRIVKKRNNYVDLTALYYYKALAFKGLKRKKESIKYFRRVDSIFSISNDIYPEFTSGYSDLVEHYISISNKDSAQYFYNQSKKVDDYSKKNYKELLKSLHTNYDIPKVIKNKEKEIKNLNQQSKWQFALLVLSLFFVGLFVILYLKTKKQRKILHDKFEKLMQNQPQQSHVLNEIINNEVETKLAISETIIADLLSKLELFENEKAYLQQDITIDYLVNLFDSNSNYVSKIINNYKKKSISQYINDLRIDFVIEQLKTNKTWRNYTIQALANEIGFNSPDSFTRAFFKKTGIKPSYFLKNVSNYKSDK